MAIEDYELRGDGTFCPVADLTQAVSYLDERFYIGNLRGEEDEPLRVGMAAMIGSEIVRVKDIQPGYVLVDRGCADTIPAPHGAGAQIWFFSESVGTDWEEYAGGETIGVKIRPHTTSGAFPIARVMPQRVDMNWRFARPYPPGRVTCNNDPWFVGKRLSADEPTLTIAWVHRNRIVQADQLVGHLDPSIDPEPGTTYTIKVYRHDETVPSRVEVGIVGDNWTYHWNQALVDLDHPTTPEEPRDLPGKIVLTTVRDGLESWQSYEIPFVLNNAGAYIYVGQLAQQTAQTSGEAEPGTLMVGAAAMTTAQVPDDYTDRPTGVMLTQVALNVGQETNFPPPLNYLLHEAPYTLNLRTENVDPEGERFFVAVGRPSDRLTDNVSLHSRLSVGQGKPAHPFVLKDTKAFTPWLAIDTPLDYLDTVATIRTSSLYDGVPLDLVKPGQMAQIGNEIVRVEKIEGDKITIARGCADTRPWPHGAGARMWFFEARHLLDRGLWFFDSRNPQTVEFKVAPIVYGPPVDLNSITSMYANVTGRKHRPFVHGDVRLNGMPWFVGGVAQPNSVIRISWARRNRLTQGKTLVDHHAPDMQPESGMVTKLQILEYLGESVVVIREVVVQGTHFDYTYDMAYEDGHRIARIRDDCGFVRTVMWLYTERDGLMSYQQYPLPLTLPGPACPAGRTPGSGGKPIVIPSPDLLHPPGEGDDRRPPYSGGDGGSVTEDPIPGVEDREPPVFEPPPGWPDVIIRLPEYPHPDMPGSGYWDYAWDKFWAARGYRDPGDDPGD